MKATEKQLIEQSIEDNKQVRESIIRKGYNDYIEAFDSIPTVGQLNWFIFEGMGLRVDEDTIQSIYSNL